MLSASTFFPTFSTRKIYGNFRHSPCLLSFVLRAHYNQRNNGTWKINLSTQLNSSRLLYIANRFWNCGNCAECLKWLKNTYFSRCPLSSPPFGSNTLDIPFIFYCLGWKQWKLLCIAIWQWEKDAANLGQSLFSLSFFSFFFSRYPSAVWWGKGKFNFCWIFFYYKWKLEIGNWTFKLFIFLRACFDRESVLTEGFERSLVQCFIANSWNSLGVDIEWSIDCHQFHW